MDTSTATNDHDGAAGARADQRQYGSFSGDNDALEDFFSDSPEGVTFHELQCKSAVAGWERIRKEMLEIVTEMQAMPPNLACIRCKNAASCRYQRCGPLGFFCIDCSLMKNIKISMCFMLLKNGR